MAEENEGSGLGGGLSSIFSSLKTKSDGDKSDRAESKSNSSSSYGYDKKRGGILDAMLGRKSGEKKSENDAPQSNRTQETAKRGFLAEMAHRISGAQSPKPAEDEQADDEQENEQDGYGRWYGGGGGRNDDPRGHEGDTQSQDGESRRGDDEEARANRHRKDSYVWETNVNENGDIEDLGFYVLSENAVILADYLSTDVVESDPVEFGDIFGVVKSYHPELKTPFDAMDYIYNYPYGDGDVFEMLSAGFDGTVDKDIVEVTRGLNYTFPLQEVVVQHLQNVGNEGRQLNDEEIKQIIIDLGPDHIDDYYPDALDCVYGMVNSYDSILPNADDDISDAWVYDTIEALNSGEVPDDLVVSSLASPSKINDRLDIGCMNEFVPDHVIAWCPFIRAGMTMNDCPIKKDSPTMCPVEMDMNETEITDCYNSVDYLIKG